MARRWARSSPGSRNSVATRRGTAEGARVREAVLATRIASNGDALWARLGMHAAWSVFSPTPVLEDVRNDLALLLADDLSAALADIDSVDPAERIGPLRVPEPIECVDVIIGMWAYSRDRGGRRPDLGTRRVGRDTTAVVQRPHRTGAAMIRFHEATRVSPIDHLRPPSPLDLQAAASKDWLHLNVFVPDRQVAALVNTSLHGDPLAPSSLAVGTTLVVDGARHVTYASIDVRPFDGASVSAWSIEVAPTAHIDLASPSGSAAASGRAVSLDGLAATAAIDVVATVLDEPIEVDRPVPFGSGWIGWRAVPRARAGRHVDARPALRGVVTPGNDRPGGRDRLSRPQLGSMALGRRHRLELGNVSRHVDKPWMSAVPETRPTTGSSATRWNESR